jgi:hypothetical protein
MNSARRGAWRAACESLESLDQKVRGQPSVWRSIAILRGWLGQEQRAAEAWKKLATLPGLAEDEMVEAEAMAILLRQTATDDLIDVMKLTYQVPETDRLMEFLISDKRSDELPIDLRHLAEDGEPAPKGAFHLFDGPMPASAEGISSVKELPSIIAEAHLYGRQTDRDARFELILNRNQRFEEHKAEIGARLGNLLGTLQKSEVIDRVSRLRAETQPNRRFPRETDVPKALEFIEEQRREVFLTRWPEIPTALFDGKSARQAAREPALRNRVLGAILNLELADVESANERHFDFNELRRLLDLPVRSTTEAVPGTISEMSVVKLGSVNFSKLSDDDLVRAYQRLLFCGFRSALQRCGREVVARPSLSDRLDMAQVLETLVVLSTDSDAALQFADIGRQLAVTRGTSPAKWLLYELQARLARREVAECDRLLRLLASHQKEPGVTEAILELLRRHGLIGADGKPVHSKADRAAAVQAEPAAASSSPIWTPDSAPERPKSESKLWLPGSS